MRRQSTEVREVVRPPAIVSGLVVLIGGLAILAAGSGLWWNDRAGPDTATSVRGEQVELFGRGLYRHDTLFAAGGQRGTDVIVLALAVPLLIAATFWYRRGSARGAFALCGVLAYLLYVYGSMALGTIAYNELFLVYVTLFSATLFALALTLRSVDASRAFPTGMPTRWPGRFMLFAGLITFGVWMSEPVSDLLGGEEPPRLDMSATLVTAALDLGIIVPLSLLAGVLIKRRAPLGYQIAFPLLGIIVLLGPTFVAQTISQLDAGVEFSIAEIAGPIVGFGITALLATWVLTALLRRLPESSTDQRLNGAVRPVPAADGD